MVKELEGSMPDHKKCIFTAASSSNNSSCKSTKVEKVRPNTKPWRGLLPKRRPSEITLEAFFPKVIEKRISEANVIPTRPSRDILIERARNFGRSCWDVFPTGPRLGKDSGAIKPKKGTTSPSPTPSNPILPTPSSRAPSLRSYAEVVRHTARPMPPYPRAFDRGHGSGRGRGAGRGWQPQRKFVPVPEDRDQQGADRNFQQNQQPQQQIEQGKVKKKGPFVSYANAVVVLMKFARQILIVLSATRRIRICRPSARS